MVARTGSRKKVKKNIVTGLAVVGSTFNNTIITITDMQGNTVAWSSSGKMGFKGARKAVPYAAQMVARDAGAIAQDHGMRELDVKVKGPGSGREMAIETLAEIGFKIKSIKDVTPIPHNGCRPRKRRRV